MQSAALVHMDRCRRRPGAADVDSALPTSLPFRDVIISSSAVLGRSGIAVSALGLGCWALGGAMAAGDQPLGYAGVDDREAEKALRRGVDSGVTLVDTSDAYGAGHSERAVGRVLSDEPSVLVATKFGNTYDEDSRQLTGTDISPGYVRRALQASLRRLGRERVDLYQLHTPTDDEQAVADLLGELEALATEGLLAWYGISTDSPAQAERFADGEHCTAVQFQLNVLDDAAQMLQVCERHDLAALCRSPLAMGLLGGRYDADTRLPADDVRGRQPEWLRWFADGAPAPEFLDRIAAVRSVLTADGRTLAQGSLAWVWGRHDRAIPLPGFRDTAQVTENVEAVAHGPLSAADIREVDRLLGRDSVGDDR